MVVFSYWLILEYILEGIFHFFSLYRFWNIIENTFFVILVVFIVGHFNSILLKQKIYNVIIILVAVMLWLETIIYLNFKIHFGPSSFFVLLNTNPDEVFEFINEYITTKEIVVTLLFFTPLIKLKLLTNNVIHITSKIQFKKHKIIKLVSFVLISLITFKYTKLIDHNLPYLICRSVILNYKDTKWIEEFNTKLETNANLVKNKNSNTKNTYIIVIGESTTSAHMQVYGYYRKTTPNLEKQKDSLSIYKNVISPNTSTFYSLSKALTLGNYEEPKKVLALPITTLFNKAGFKTFWISNHSPAFNPGSALARVSSGAQSKFFNSKEVVINNVKHDGELLNKVDLALEDEAQNKVIFLHLIGAHFTYKNRYPSEFNQFTKKPVTKFNKKNAFDKINEYDNAISYTDFIINQVLNKLKDKKSNRYLMFFSDHGEEVFQDKDFYGHLEDRPTKNTYKIPFIMWYSKGFKYPEDYFFDENRKYMTDDLWHSIAHISGLESEFIDLKRSIFSSKFLKRKRIILKNKDYETFFK